MKRSLVESIDQLWVQLESLKQDVVEQERRAEKNRSGHLSGLRWLGAIDNLQRMQQLPRTQRALLNHRLAQGGKSVTSSPALGRANASLTREKTWIRKGTTVE